jgi:hypothetical protein
VYALRVTDELKPPVAIRITRPYATEAEFLEREFDTLTHTSVILLGAQSRPPGVVLRFEIVLKSGESLLRGEGRVVGYKEKAYAGEPGLSLRFTRLDSRSKTLVDRASALREARVRASTSLMAMPAVVVPRGPAAGTAPPPIPSVPALDSAPRIPTPIPSRPSSPPSSRRGPPPLPEWARSAPPPAIPSPPPPSMDMESTQVDAHFERVERVERVPASTPERAPQKKSSAPPAPPAPSRGIRPTPARPPPIPRTTTLTSSPPPPPAFLGAAKASGGGLARPADRDALLSRLRTRAESLPASRVREILAQRRA